MLILPTRHVVFQEEVKLISHALQNDLVIHPRTATMQYWMPFFSDISSCISWMELDALRQVFGMLAPRLMFSPNKCFSAMLLYNFVSKFDLVIVLLLKVQLLGYKA